MYSEMALLLSRWELRVYRQSWDILLQLSGCSFLCPHSLGVLGSELIVELQSELYQAVKVLFCHSRHTLLDKQTGDPGGHTSRYLCYLLTKLCVLTKTLSKKTRHSFQGFAIKQVFDYLVCPPQFNVLMQRSV